VPAVLKIALKFKIKEAKKAVEVLSYP
jgi:hypothetical protein